MMLWSRPSQAIGPAASSLRHGVARGEDVDEAEHDQHALARARDQAQLGLRA